MMKLVIRIVNILLVPVLVVVIVGLGADSCRSRKSIKSDIYTNMLRSELESQLNEYDRLYEVIRARVESAHLTVKVGKMSLRKIKITTRDGSDYADVGNISSIYIEVVAYWKGHIKSGHTVVGFDMDSLGNVKNVPQIIETTALVNLK